MVICIPTIAFAKTDLTIMPIDYVNGDATLLESNGEYLLVDVGIGGTDYETVLFDYLEKNNVTKFDLYLSHYHGDHYGSDSGVSDKSDLRANLFRYLMSLNGKKYTIENVYIPAVSKRDKLVYDGIEEEYTLDKCSNVLETDPDVLKYECSIYNKHDHFVKYAEKYNINLVELKTGSKFKVGNTRAEVLYLNTDATVFAPINNSSLVTMFTSGKVKFLTAGDIEKYAENEILKKGIDISADIFKLSHHGWDYKENTSNIPAFLSKVNPKYVYCQFRDTAKGLYYYLDDEGNVELADVANLYAYRKDIDGAKINIKFVIEDNEITPVIENIDGTNGKSITINYIDKKSGEVLKTRKFDFALYTFASNSNHPYINDGTTTVGTIKNQYHLYDYKETFEGYILDSGEDLIVENGIVEKNKTYNVYYKKNTYTLTVKYVDEDGNKLLDDEIITYEYDTPYVASVKLLEGYDLVEEPSNLSGTIRQNTVVTFVYKLKEQDEDDKIVYTLTIKHVDEDGNKLLDDEIKTFELDETYETSANDKLLEEYDLVEKPSNAKGNIQENTVVTYVYKLKEKPSNPSTNISTPYIIFGIFIVVGFVIMFVYKRKKFL